MRIVVCVRQGLDGEINPFDACAYEEALRVPNAEVILLSMGPESAKDFLLRLTRLGAKKAILLSDKAFAGADTIATAYTLSLSVKKLSPDLVFCGRQTLIGDTAQTGPMLSVYADMSLITNVMEIKTGDNTCFLSSLKPLSIVFAPYSTISYTPNRFDINIFKIGNFTSNSIDIHLNNHIIELHNLNSAYFINEGYFSSINFKLFLQFLYLFLFHL